jgi:hypothetical protein
MAGETGEGTKGGNGDKATDAGDEAAADMNGRLMTGEKMTHYCTNQ